MVELGKHARQGKKSVDHTLVGLPRDALLLLERTGRRGQLDEHEDRSLQRRIRGAAAFLTRANFGMQWEDFGRRDPSMMRDRDKNRVARSMVLATLLPMEYPGEPIPYRLEGDKRARVHRSLTALRTTMLQAMDGVKLSAEEVEQIPRVLEFFRNFGLQEFKG